MLLSAIHQLEITSRCNLACKYCVHPTMPRPKVDMTDSHFERSLDWIRYFVRRGTQGEVSMHGIGESTLHPKFGEWCLRTRQVIGPHRRLTTATNGINVTEEQAKAMAEARMLVWVSLHRPERAVNAVELLRKHGVLEGFSTDPATAAVDWAGQIKWPVSAPKFRCPWLTHGWAMVLADGRLTTCSMDGQGTDGVVGSVDDPPSPLPLKPYSLCPNCHQYIP